MGSRTWILVLAIGAFLLAAGCLGGAEDGEDVEQAGEVAYATEDTGAVEGVITDEAVQPLSDVNVTLVEEDRSTTSTADGTYAFSEVQPGTHTLRLDAEGYHSTEGEVEVYRGEVTARDFVISQATDEEAYMVTQELEGFFECGFEVGWNVSSQAPEPPEDVPDARSFYLGLAACAVPNNVLEMVGGGGNATNDKFSHSYELEHMLNTFVYEMQWEPENTFSDWMTTRTEVQGFANQYPGTLFRTQGPSVIHERVDRDQLDELERAFEEECEAGNDAYCGYSWEVEGYPLQTRVFPAWQCASEDGGGCAVVQQPFTNYLSVFYNEPAPEGYRLVDG